MTEQNIELLQQRISHLEKLADDAGKTLTFMQSRIDLLTAERDQLIEKNNKLVTENVGLKAKGREVLKEASYVYSHYNRMVEHLDGEIIDGQTLHELQEVIELETPSTDAAIAAIRAEGRKEGAIFAANRMLAAWDAGFVEDTPENAADIAHAILSMTDFMDDAPEGDFNRSFADEMLEAIADYLRQSVQVKSEGVKS